MLSERVIGKKAWVTGAAHGIGRASAWALAEAGADVAISDINEKELEETAEYIRKLGRKALVLPADITKENEIEETINTIVDKWGKLDIAYCNAGTFQDIPAEDMPLEEFERVIKVNLTGAVAMAESDVYLFTCSRKSNNKTKKRKYYPYCIYVRTYSKYSTMPMCI